MNRLSAQLVGACVGMLAFEPSALAAPSKEVSSDGYVVEAGMSQEWIELDEQVELEELEKSPPLRKLDEQALHVNDAWKDGSTSPPPSEGDNGRVTLTYGAALPRIFCAPLRQCMIQLKEGEKVTDIHASDPVRWRVDLSMSGATTYVVVKPKVAGVGTDLAVITDQRAYVLDLVSHATKHMAIVSFEYPDDQREAWRRAIIGQQRRVTEQPAVPKPTAEDRLISVHPQKLNTKYEIAVDHPWFCRRRRTCVDWVPVQVVDDGKRTWITMPPSIEGKSLPVLYAKTSAGREKVAYRYKPEEHTFYVDQVMNKAELMLGVGGKGGIVTLVRKAKP
jgi:type IV secretion system protein TrbG